MQVLCKTVIALSISLASGCGVTLRGTVVDKAGNPVPGAHVSSKCMYSGITPMSLNYARRYCDTDENGQFKLRVPTFPGSVEATSPDDTMHGSTGVLKRFGRNVIRLEFKKAKGSIVYR